MKAVLRISHLLNCQHRRLQRRANMSWAPDRIGKMQELWTRVFKYLTYQTHFYISFYHRNLWEFYHKSQPTETSWIIRKFSTWNKSVRRHYNWWQSFFTVQSTAAFSTGSTLCTRYRVQQHSLQLRHSSTLCTRYRVQLWHSTAVLCTQSVQLYSVHYIQDIKVFCKTAAALKTE